MARLIAVLIAAHLISDFFLQTGRWARLKGRRPFLLMHAALHALFTYLVLQTWACWQVVVLIFILHAAIDGLKQRAGKETSTIFLIDQAIHVLSLIGIAWLSVHFGWIVFFTRTGYGLLILSAGFITAVNGAGIYIGKFAGELTELNNLKLDGLVHGGKWIGRLERALIFLFIIMHYPGGIGFLVAAKSILRFEEARQQKLAEYVLIGTFLSFFSAVAIALLTRWAAGL